MPLGDTAHFLNQTEGKTRKIFQTFVKSQEIRLPKLELITLGGYKPVMNYDLGHFNAHEQADVLEQINLLRRIVDNSPAFISYVDEDLHYRFVNQYYTEWFKTDPEKILGQHVQEILGPEVFSRHTPFLQRALNGEEVHLESKINTPSGNLYLSVNYVPYNYQGSPRGFFVMAHDITQRKLIELDQRMLAELASRITDHTRPEELVKDVTTTLALHLGVERCWYCEVDDIKGISTVVEEYKKPSMTPLKGSYQLSEYGRSLIENWRSTPITAINDVDNNDLTKDVVERYHDLNLRCFVGLPLFRDGKVAGNMGMGEGSPRVWLAHEIDLFRSASKLLWAQLENLRLLKELKEAVNARDEFLSICSHELRTPLTSMMLQFQLAKKLIERGDHSVYSEEVVNRRVDVMNRQLDRMSRMIDDMLDVSRIAAGKLICEFEPLDLSDTVLETIERFQQQLDILGITLKLNFKQDIHVMADRNRLHQLVANLLSNAIKYGNEKPISMTIEKQIDSVRLIVSDQGDGIAPENLDRIFHRFERAVESTTISGLGLGLYISRQIVLHHDGKIWAESQLGKGTSFIVELPILDIELE